MKKEIPRGAVIAIIAGVAIIVVGLIAMQFAGGGPGRMSSEDVKRAEMEAEAGNARMRGYIPAGTPGAPPAEADNRPAEMIAREKASQGG